METEEREKLDALDVFASSTQPIHDSIHHAAKMLRHAVDRAANEMAKHRADWYDVPRDENPEEYDAYHAPADVQYPREVRDEFCREMLNWWLNEFNTQEGGQQ
jgi:hypothetical protein